MGRNAASRLLRWRRLAALIRVAVARSMPLLLDALWRRRVRAEDAARSLRVALEDLGLTYLKLGQFLATRHDLVPGAVVRELTGLFEQVPALRAELVSGIIARELGAAPSLLFESFEPTPIAAATVAQVHRARLADGTAVAVKVQRPGIESIFEADIANLTMLARLSDRLGLLGAMSAEEIAQQFAAYTRREFDFLLEAGTADRMRREARAECLVPWIVWRLSTRRILTMQFMQGISLARVVALIEGGDGQRLRELLPSFDKRRVLENLTLVSLHQFFVTGVFHGDPHPGNILVRPDNRVVLLDFGIFGELSAPAQDLLANYAENLAVGNVAESFRHLSQIYFPGARSDRHAFRQDAIATLRRWYLASKDAATPASARHLGASFDAMVGVVRRHHYSTTMDYLLFWRAIIVLDSIALRLDPAFDLAAEMRRFFETLRSPLVERMLRIAADPKWRADVRAAIRIEPSAVDRNAERIGGRIRAFRLSGREQRGPRRARRRRTYLPILGVLSMGIIVAAPASQSPTVVAMLLAGAMAAAGAAIAGSIHGR